MPVRRYAFRVSGHLSERAQDAFADMLVDDALLETIIYGDVVDDSQLHGVLALIQNLGLHVVSVNEVAPKAEENARQGPSSDAGSDDGPRSPRTEGRLRPRRSAEKD